MRAKERERYTGETNDGWVRVRTRKERNESVRVREKGDPGLNIIENGKGRPTELCGGQLEGPSQYFFVLFHSFPRRRNGGRPVAALKKGGRCKRDFHIQEEK